MSTGRPPAAEVASMSTSASPWGRTTGTATPVEVSLWAQATTSTDGSDSGPMSAIADGGLGALPASALMMIGSPTNGFLTTHEANFELNSPYVRCSERSSISPNAAASQN